MNIGLITRWCASALALAQALTLVTSAAEKAAPLSTFGKLPIKEITVFKDGHAFVAHEGEMPADEHGNVVMDYLPAPVIGTFWPYSAEKRAKLTSVVTSQKRVLVERTALSVRELLQANIDPNQSIELGYQWHYFWRWKPRGTSSGCKVSYLWTRPYCTRPSRGLRWRYGNMSGR